MARSPRSSAKTKAPIGSAKRSVTLRHVAEASGVSLMTVSNVINGKLHLMSPETLKRVRAAIASLNYRPHLGARGLRRAQHLSVGMIIVDDAPAYLADPFITNLVAGLGNSLSERGYALIIQGIAPARFDGAALLRGLRADGFCALLSGSANLRRRYLATLSEFDGPTIVFQERAPKNDPDMCSIRADDREGGRLLAEHLIERGARRFVTLSPRATWPANAERRKGLGDALRRHPGPFTVDHIAVEEESNFEEIQQALRDYIRTAGVPDAIVSANDQMGIAALHLLRKEGLAVPEQVKVTGFNGFDFRKYSDPMLTSVKSNAYQMGMQGAEELLRFLAVGSFSARDIVVPVQILPGGTT